MRSGKIIRSGFTLVEVLVSALLLLVAASSFTVVFSRAFFFTSHLLSFTSATLSVQSEFEELKSRSFDEITISGEITFDGGKGIARTTKIFSDLIKIEITYQFEEDKAPIKVATMRSRY